MYVCICTGITDRDVRKAAREGATDLAQLSAMTGCSTVCGSCGDLAMEILREADQDARPVPLALPLVAA